MSEEAGKITQPMRETSPEHTRPDLPAGLKPLFDALKIDADEREHRSKLRETEREAAREERAKARHQTLADEIVKLHSYNQEMRSDIADLKFRADRADRMSFPAIPLWWLVVGLWALGLSGLAFAIYAHAVR